MALLTIGAIPVNGSVARAYSSRPVLGTPSIATEEATSTVSPGTRKMEENSTDASVSGAMAPTATARVENAQWIDPKPRDFTEATFKCRSTPTGTLPTDEDLFNAITRGFVTTNMPSWRPLTPYQRADLVAFIKTWSPRWAKEKPGTPLNIPPETPITIDSILRGRAMFQKLECWKCHGPRGHGDGPSASTLTDDKGNPIDRTIFRRVSDLCAAIPTAILYRIFMTGLDGSPMPSFADVVKPDEAWDLVHFLRTLQPLHTQEAHTVASSTYQLTAKTSSRSVRMRRPGHSNSLEKEGLIRCD